jgi:hypothetical protein
MTAEHPTRIRHALCSPCLADHRVLDIDAGLNWMRVPLAKPRPSRYIHAPGRVQGASVPLHAPGKLDKELANGPNC